MPTPSDSVVDNTRSQHNTCPPEDRLRTSSRDRIDEFEHHADGGQTSLAMAVDDIMPAQSQQQRVLGSAEDVQDVATESTNKNTEIELDMPTASEMSSPASVESKLDAGAQRPILTDSYIGISPSMSHEFSNVRVGNRIYHQSTST